MTEISAPRMPRELTSPRLHLTWVRAEDADAQREVIDASLPELRRWLPWAQERQDPAEARLRAQADADAAREGREYNWLIRAGDAQVLGRVSLFALRPQIPAGEIGYWLGTAHTGRGYMTEAVAAVTNAALSAGYRRIELRCDARNLASAAVARRCGFTQEGLLRRHDVAAGEPGRLRDTLVFARIH